MRKIPLLLLALLVSAFPVLVHGEEDFTEAESIIEQKVPCENLSDDQLEKLGDYYMEQMHPGEAHELMDERMGGEGSESLRQVHINMARTFYCGESGMMGPGMMPMMMGGYTNQGGRTNMMWNYGGMMGGSGFWGMTTYGLLYTALAAFVFGIIFWLTYNLIVKNKKR